jgi:hypothetical protein
MTLGELRGAYVRGIVGPIRRVAGNTCRHAEDEIHYVTVTYCTVC